MKTILLLLVVCISTTSFKPVNIYTQSQTQNSKALTIDRTNDWGSWKYSSCHTKLAFRVRKNNAPNNKTAWEVQFRNDYTETIHFSYFITEPGNGDAYIDDDGKAKSLPYRKTLQPGQLTSEFTFSIYTNSYEKCLVLMAQVRLGDDSGPYENCN